MGALFYGVNQPPPSPLPLYVTVFPYHSFCALCLPTTPHGAWRAVISNGSVDFVDTTTDATFPNRGHGDPSCECSGFFFLFIQEIGSFFFFFFFRRMWRNVL